MPWRGGWGRTAGVGHGGGMWKSRLLFWVPACLPGWKRQPAHRPPARLLAPPQRRGPRKASADPAQLADAAPPAAALPVVAAAPVPEPPREQREQRVVPTRAAAVHHQAPPPQPRPQRRFAGYNVRRGGGALSPRTTVASSGGPRRQQPWQMLLPAGVPPTPLTPDQCRHQVMADLVYLFKWVPLKTACAASVWVPGAAPALCCRLAGICVAAGGRPFPTLLCIRVVLVGQRRSGLVRRVRQGCLLAVGNCAHAGQHAGWQAHASRRWPSSHHAQPPTPPPPPPSLQQRAAAVQAGRRFGGAEEGAGCGGRRRRAGAAARAAHGPAAARGAGRAKA